MQATDKAKDELKKQTNKLKNAMDGPVLIEPIVPIIVNIVCFIIIGVLWFENITYFKPENKEKFHTTGVVIVYIIYILFNIYYTNSLSFKVCPTSQIMKSISIVITNFIMFILLTKFVLEVLPGFLEPFANVLGNIVISFDGFKLDEKLSYVLLDPSKGSEISQKISEEPSILLNSMSSQTIENDIENIQKYKDKTPIIKTVEDWTEEALKIQDPSENAIFIKNSTNGIKNLKKILAVRDAVAYFSWMVLAGFMFLSTNVSQILNVIDCETDGNQLQKIIDSTYDISSKAGSLANQGAQEAGSLANQGAQEAGSLAQ